MQPIRYVLLLQTVAVLAACATVPAVDWTIVAYDQKDFNGQRQEVTIGEGKCVRLKTPPLSLNTNGSCVRLFPEDDCSGDGLRLSAKDGCLLPDLTDAGDEPMFDDETPVKSVSGCRDASGESQVPDCGASDRSHKLSEDAAEVIRYFDEPDMKGRMWRIALTASSCHELPYDGFKVQSVETSGDCVQFFHEPGCTGESRKILPLSGITAATYLRTVRYLDSGDTVGDFSRSLRSCRAP